MDVQTVALFYALLAVVANVVVVAIIATVADGRAGALRAVIGPGAVPLAFGVAALAMLGSLYFSEIARFEPCRLCWFQRIAMYPLVVILGIAAARRDTAVRWYVIPLAATGAFISVYHYVVEWVPWLDTGVCPATTPCSIVWFRELGFVTLPYLALSAFLLIITLVAIESPGERVAVVAPPRTVQGA
jgi:disulfide bond formation protein DsbB